MGRWCRLQQVGENYRPQPRRSGPRIGPRLLPDSHSSAGRHWSITRTALPSAWPARCLPSSSSKIAVKMITTTILIRPTVLVMAGRAEQGMVREQILLCPMVTEVILAYLINDAFHFSYFLDNFLVFFFFLHCFKLSFFVVFLFGLSWWFEWTKKNEVSSFDEDSHHWRASSFTRRH